MLDSARLRIATLALGLFINSSSGAAFAADFTQLSSEEKYQEIQGLIQEEPTNPGALAGFHGTSIQTVQELLKTGRLPAGSVYKKHLPKLYQGPAIYFAEIPDQVPRHVPFIPQPSAERRQAQSPLQGKSFFYHDTLNHIWGAADQAEAKNIAIGYASINSAANGILKRLGLPYTDKNWARAAELSLADFFEGTDDGAFERPARYFRKLGISRKTLRDVSKPDDSTKGVLLGIKSTVYRDFPVVADGDQGLRLIVNEGLPLEYIEFIIPLGQKEREFFDRLNPALIADLSCEDYFSALAAK